jgi:PKD repeat protein
MTFTSFTSGTAAVAAQVNANFNPCQIHDGDRVFTAVNTISNGGTLQSASGSTWNTCNLTTTVTGSTAWAARTGNDILLKSAGNYYVEAYTSFSAGGISCTRLYNTTAGTTLVTGPLLATVVSDTSVFPMTGNFNLTTASTVNLQTYSQNAATGFAFTTGDNSTQHRITIWRIS